MSRRFILLTHRMAKDRVRAMKNFGTKLSFTAQLAVLAFAAISVGGPSAVRAAPAPFVPPQNAAGCLDLAAYLSQLRGQPDKLFMHHQLVDVTLQGSDES